MKLMLLQIDRSEPAGWLMAESAYELIHIMARSGNLELLGIAPRLERFNGGAIEQLPAKSDLGNGWWLSVVR